ncbi:glycosyltransferase family 2 protein [Clostridium estertheticum]|uniref:Glycosyltransferase n=1 Tax=Clostridium estertheticum TaxID=238834 RepID=A0A7Y3SXR9_9CLOT|nr:glycosyltransferase [Clostridium estertheticum]NNU77319.1 glycosyltransferase [Clostridium estertheticum]WBL47054.1 glycosyltransferase [Clostridium estertheticum]
MAKISVIMGVFNGEKHVSKAIDSILNQTYSDFELIICDDASTDNSLNIIKNYISKYDRIILVENDVNLGLAATLNRCLEVAKGEYIARMDDDDVSLPHRFEKQIEYLEANPNCTILGGAARLYDGEGDYGKISHKRNPNKIDIFKSPKFIHPTVIMRSEALKKVSGYTVADYTKRTEDYDLWCKLYANGYKGSNLQEVILNYYEGRDSYKKKKFKHRIDSIKLRKIWRKKLKIPFNIYFVTIFKIIIGGLLPNKFMMKYHRVKFKE